MEKKKSSGIGAIIVVLIIALVGGYIWKGDEISLRLRSDKEITTDMISKSGLINIISSKIEKDFEDKWVYGMAEKGGIEIEDVWVEIHNDIKSSISQYQYNERKFLKDEETGRCHYNYDFVIPMLVSVKESSYEGYWLIGTANVVGTLMVYPDNTYAYIDNIEYCEDLLEFVIYTHACESFEEG